MAGPISHYEVRWRLDTSDEEWTYQRLEVNQTQITISGVDRTKTYVIQARSIGPTGLASVWVDISHTVAGNLEPDIPLGFTATTVANGVRLDWYFDRTQSADVETVIERSVNNLADSFFEVGSVKGTSIIVAETSPGTFYYRAYTKNYYDKFSDHTPVITGTPLVVNLGTNTLSIVGGVLTIDCNYKNHYLLLNADVTSIVFTNVSVADTVIIHVEQTGTFNMTFNAGVTPISGAAYTTSQFAGAVDVLGLHTVDGGGTWKMAYQKPVGDGNSSVVVSITPSPASDTETVVGTTPVAPSVQVTALATGGDETFTYLWECVDNGGQAAFNISSSTAMDPTFSIASGISGYNCTQTWRVTATDGGGLQDVETVQVTLIRNASGGGSGAFYITANPTSVSESIYTPYGEPEPVVGSTTITPHNEVGTVTYTATKLEGTGPTPTQYKYTDGSEMASFTWRIAAGYTNVSHYAIWRITATNGANSSYLDIEVYLERANNL